MKRMLWWVGLMVAPLWAEELAVKQAGEARVHLSVGTDSEPLAAVEISEGSVGRGSWLESEAARERMVDVMFPVDSWRWTDVTLGFTPRGDGEVEILLNGVWGQKEPGVLYRQEILWDEVRGSGTTVSNPGLDGGEHGLPEGWSSPWRPYLKAGEWPLGEEGVGASWHGRPLVQKVPVEAGKRVELTFRAKAALPPDMNEPPRLGGDTPAHKANAKLKRGVNLGNNWEAEPGTWGVGYAPEDVDRIADHGFDHIRVPVGWHFFIQDGKISPEFLAELEPVMKRALDRGMRVMLDWHHFEDLVKEPSKHQQRFADGWREIARHFKDWPEGLYFELLNEPNGALEGPVLNEVHAAAIAAIRETNPKRSIVVNPGQWAAVPGFDELRFPDGEDRIIVSFHCYEPFQFTHQEAHWTGLEGLENVVYPGPPAEPLEVPESLRHRSDIVRWIEDYNTLEGDRNPSSRNTIEEVLDDAVEWSEHFGRPIHLGEFGVYSVADEASRRRYTRDAREAAEERGIPWCWWEWKAGFGIWDPEKNEPILVEELMRD